MQAMKKLKWLAVLEYQRLYILMVVIYCYFGKREIYVNNLSYIEMSVSLF